MPTMSIIIDVSQIHDDVPHAPVHVVQEVGTQQRRGGRGNLAGGIDDGYRSAAVGAHVQGVYLCRRH